MSVAGERAIAPESSAPRRDAPARQKVPPDAAILGLHRAAGNRAVAGLLRSHPVTPPVAWPPVLQRVKLQDGPPLAPGNYRYGTTIVGLAPGAMRTLLTDMAGRSGLDAERKWQAEFTSDLRGQRKDLHSYEDPNSKQSVSVEPTLAGDAERAQVQVENQALAVQNQFQQQLLGRVRSMLDASQSKLEAEGRRYGFPDDESIFSPKQQSAGQASLAPAMPASNDLRGVIRGAKALQDGQRKIRTAREAVAKLGPILGDAVRPTTLEPVLAEHHKLRQKVCGEYPILASVERNPDRLAEMASGSQFAGPGSTGQGAAAALAKVKEETRKELADKLSNIAYICERMNEPDKIDRFWLDAPLRESVKRSLAIAPSTLQNAVIEAKVQNLVREAEFEAKLKAVVGTGLLILSFVPGVGAVAGAAGLLLGAADVISAFQDYYWEQAAAGTALEKAEAISQTEPSLFGLAVSIAVGLLEGVAEAKALEGAIGVFKAVSAAYREARAAGVAAKLGSGAAKATGAADLAAAAEKLRTTANEASGKAGLGEKILADLPGDVKATAASLDRSLKQIKDPALKDLIRKGDKPITDRGETLMDLAIRDPHGLEADFAEWQRGKSGKTFDDWLRNLKQAHAHGVLTEPAGLIEYGMNQAEARRSFEACLREDPSREAGTWRDPETNEHVTVQGGPGFVSSGWMADADSLWAGRRPKWELVIHHHPNRGIPIDRLPSRADFSHITGAQRAGGPPRPVRSLIAWTDPASKIRFETEFGYTPGAPRPYWTRYRVEDGTFRTASFAEAPFGAGEAEYLRFIDSFTGRPGDAVPGGNLPPVSLPPRRP